MDISFAPYRKVLDEAAINVFANWLDPSDKDAINARAQAEVALAKLPNLETAVKQTNELWQSLKQPVGRHFLWIGWLFRNASNQWECDSPSPIKESGTLFVIRGGDKTNPVCLDCIGESDGNTIKMRTNIEPPSLVEGRPVYLVETSKSETSH
jgi:hypothetical protein